MPNDILQISGALADPTRYAIYQFVMAAGEPVTVANVVSRFSLHSNVARMHLNRLRDVGLLDGEIEKSGRGGRPGMIYLPSREPLNLSFPSREYRFLAEILLDAVSRLGSEGTRTATAAAAARGLELFRRTTAEAESELESAASLLNRIGFDVRISPADSDSNSRSSALVTLQNCPFLELARNHPHVVCSLCRRLVSSALGELSKPETSYGNSETRGTAATGERWCQHRVSWSRNPTPPN